MHFDQILTALKHARPRRHTPRFRLRREKNGWRIFDGSEAIAFAYQRGYYHFDIWSFSPFEPHVMANPDPPGAVVDLHTLHNTTINLPFVSAPELVKGVPDPLACVRWKWIRPSGKELHLRIAGTLREGQRIEYNVRIAYDPQWARYRFFLDADVWKRTRTGLEPINMMLAGALASRPEQRRWTHSIWEDAQGKLKRLVHSNTLFSVTDFVNSEWRTKNGPHPRSWIGYAAHPEFNPAMLVHHTNAPVCFATCSQLFDEHLIWHSAGLDDLDNGFFHFVMRTELINLPSRLASSFLKQAEDPPRPRKWRRAEIALPFHMNAVNSFEKPVDPWQPEECPILVLSKAKDAPIQWVQGEAHTGRHSLRFEARRPHDRRGLFPVGAVCNVERNARYRLSAWVKTRDVERFARLELVSYEYTYDNVLDVHQSPKLNGTEGWTCLAVEMDTGEAAYLMPRLMLYGPGTAWFDDVKLERVG